MNEKQYFDNINGYYVKDSDARESIEDIKNGTTGIGARVTKLESDFTELDNRVTSAETNINNINSELDVKNNFIKISLDQDYTITQDIIYENLSLTRTILTNGSLLTNSNGSIKIGAGIHHVLISGSVYWNELGAENRGKAVRIYNNDNFILQNDIYGLNYLHSSIPATIISVNENDLISVKVKGNTGDIISSNGAGTFLNVIVLD